MFDLKRPARDAALPPVRLTAAERRLVDREARRRGLTASDLVRLAVGALLAKSLQDPKVYEDARQVFLNVGQGRMAPSCTCGCTEVVSDNSMTPRHFTCAACGEPWRVTEAPTIPADGIIAGEGTGR